MLGNSIVVCMPHLQALITKWLRGHVTAKASAACSLFHSRMERVITSLDCPLATPHCTLAPLSAAVAFSMMMVDGFGPKPESGDAILSTALFRVCPKAPEVPTKPGKALRVQINSPASVAASQENVKLSPEQVCPLTRCKLTEGDRKEMIIHVCTTSLYKSQLISPPTQLSRSTAYIAIASFS